MGETVLAFFTAKNNSDHPIVGVATYNVMPMRSGLYFNKIQCFCFDEQLVNAHEEVDMPVFFYIDPEMLNDVGMSEVTEIILSYHFYESKAGLFEEEELPWLKDQQNEIMQRHQSKIDQLKNARA